MRSGGDSANLLDTGIVGDTAVVAIGCNHLLPNALMAVFVVVVLLEVQTCWAGVRLLSAQWLFPPQ